MQSFSSTDKMKIRQDDLSLIIELSKKANRKLAYLGLPSPWMGDVLAWKPYLEQIYAIEKEKAYLSHVMDKAYALGLLNRFSYFYGDVDVISGTQIDLFGKSIAAVFPVDLINLDYCEGLDYQEFSKLSTLASLILMQNKALKTGAISKSFPYFIILLTHNLPQHEGNPKAKIDYLKFLTRDIGLFEEALKEKVQKTLQWYLSTECPSAYQHKCFVMGKLFEYAQAHEFKAVPKKIIRYFGDKDAIMMHYQFQLIPVKVQQMVPVDHKMSVIDLMNYPVVDMEDNNIVYNFPFIHL